ASRSTATASPTSPRGARPAPGGAVSCSATRGRSGPRISVDTTDGTRLLACLFEREAPMSTQGRYAIAVNQLEWPVPGQFDTVFRWEYEDARDALVRLYEKAKNLQWNTNTRIDWSQDLDPENPQELPDESVSIFGSEIWNRLTSREKANVRRHALAALAVPARRAGCAHLHGEDRPAGAERRRQVLRGDAGDGRGAPRRDLLAAAAREVRARLPDHADAAAVAARRALGRALGHDLPRHAGADR